MLPPGIEKILRDLETQRDDLLATMIGCKALIELDGDPHGCARTMQQAIERVTGKEPPPAVAMRSRAVKVFITDEPDGYGDGTMLPVLLREQAI